MSVPLKALIVDDSEDDALLLTRHLRQSGFAPEVVRVDTAATLRDALNADSWNVVLCDFMLPELDTFTALTEIQKAGLDVPFIVVSGAVGEDQLVDLMRAGAHDVVLKDKLARLAPALERELNDAAMRREHQRTELHMCQAIESMSDGFALYDADDRLVICNSRYKAMSGAAADLVVQGARFENIIRYAAQQGDHPDADGRVDEWVAERLAQRREGMRRVERQLADGRWLLITESRTVDGGTIAIRTDFTAQKLAEERLRESEARFRGAFETAPHGIALIDVNGRWLTANPALCELLGYDSAELTEMDVQSVTHADDLETELDHVRQILAGAVQTYQMEKRYIHKAGHVVWALVSVAALRDGNGEPTHFVSQVLDLTERRQTEAQLRQAQKMEAVGQLTGGLAHDFNNLLTVVLGNLGLLEEAVEGNETASRQARSAVEAAERGAELTERLLAFSRRQSLDPTVVNVNDLVTNTYDLLDRSLQEAVVLKTVLTPDLWATSIDPTQLETALLNLTINARDAMPSGGTVTIETANVVLRARDIADGADLAPGEYVSITISDDGTGMPSDVVAQVFQPFFTTKETGKGSGLGLSMVYGFVKQSGGHVVIDSAPGDGTEIRLYLPRTQAAPTKSTRPDPGIDAPHGGGETLLVVEDDPPVREVTVSILQELGYNVLQATNGPEALLHLYKNDGIDLLFSDTVMPGGMNGLELARAALLRRPDLKVLHASGNAQPTISGMDANLDDLDLLQKPYRKETLARRVRQKLDS